VAELLARISSAELTEWMSYCRLEEEDRQAAAAANGTAGRPAAG
jgi:hypothetical protein